MLGTDPPVTGNAELGAAFRHSALNSIANPEETVVVILTEKPAEVLRDQVVLEAVALADYLLGNRRRGFVDRGVRQLVVLRDEPNRLMSVWHQSPNARESLSIRKGRGRDGRAEVFPPPSRIHASGEAREEGRSQSAGSVFVHLDKLVRGEPNPTPGALDLFSY